MEVHHHGHVHHKQKWKDYLFQFFMLFLAVFCGFLAEYKLEQTIERHREKDYIRSYVDNLKMDTSSLNDFRQRNKTRILFLDSLLALKTQDLSQPQNCWMFYYYYIRSRFNPNYTPKDATVTQLKNSGNFRLIRNTDVIDSILKYDGSNRYILERGGYVYARMQRTWEAANPIMDLSIIRDTVYYDYPKRKLIKQPPPLINDPEKHRMFFNAVAEESRVTTAYLESLTWTRFMAEAHLHFIKKEYHLKDE